MSYFNLPGHGDTTTNGMWFDNRPVTTFDDALGSCHIPDCDILGCDYGNDLYTVDKQLTYYGPEGLWLCPAHYAEIEAEAQPYEAPRLTRLFDHTQLTTPA